MSMIHINKEKKQIIFQSDDKKIFVKDLIQAYVSDDGEKVYLAYFKTEEYVPVWEYENKARWGSVSENNTSYRVFYINGVQGIELKNYENANWESQYTKDRVIQTYNLIEALNHIIMVLNKNLICNKYKYSGDIKQVFKQVSEIKNEKIVLEHLKDIEQLKFIDDVCSNGNPLICFDKNDLTYESVDEYKFEYDSPERENAEKENKKRQIECYQKFVDKLLKNEEVISI